MEQPKEIRPRPGETHLERFLHLDDVGVLELLRLETRLHQQLIMGDAANMRLALRELHEFLRAHPRMIALRKLILIYAEQMEAQGWSAHAERWLVLYAKVTKNEEPLRAFLVSHARLDDALERFSDKLTDDEIRVMAASHLKQAYDERGTTGTRLETAIRGYGAIRDRDGLTKCLGLAIICGEVGDAELAAEALKRKMTHHERCELGLGMIKRFTRPHADMLEYIKRHRLPSLHRPFIAAAVRHDVQFSTIKEWAGDLGITVSARQKEALFAKAEARLPVPDFKTMVELAEDLAASFPRWKRRLSRLYTRAREAMVELGDVELAQRYGFEINKPLTIPELLALYGRLLVEDERGSAEEALVRTSFLIVNEALDLSASQAKPRKKKTAPTP